MHKATVRYFKGKDSFIFKHRARIGKIAKKCSCDIFRYLEKHAIYMRCTAVAVAQRWYGLCADIIELRPCKGLTCACLIKLDSFYCWWSFVLIIVTLALGDALMNLSNVFANFDLFLKLTLMLTPLQNRHTPLSKLFLILFVLIPSYKSMWIFIGHGKITRGIKFKTLGNQKKRIFRV